MHLNLSLDSTELFELLSEVHEPLFGIGQALSESIVVEGDLLATPAADHLVVRLKPTEALRSLVSASRAGDANFEAAQKARHYILPTPAIIGG